MQLHIIHNIVMVLILYRYSLSCVVIYTMHSDEEVPCFAILMSKHQEQLPAKCLQNLCSSFPMVVACVSQREFLHPGSRLLYIPGRRKARAKNAEDRVY